VRDRENKYTGMIRVEQGEDNRENKYTGMIRVEQGEDKEFPMVLNHTLADQL